MESLSRRLARAALSLKPGDLPESVVDKVKIGLLDMLSCVFEARDLPWGRQAMQMERSRRGVAGIDRRCEPLSMRRLATAWFAKICIRAR